MASARTGLPEEATGSFGYREPRFKPDPGQAFSALDISCPEPECKAPKGGNCAGVRVCSSRIAAARAAIQSGRLQSRGPAAPLPEVCASCGMKRRNARPLPCSEAHRCPKVVAGYRCKYAVEPGLDLCGHHQMFAPQGKPGRKPKLTPQVLARVHELRSEGVTIREIAAELEVSDGTVIRWIRESAQASD